MKYLIIKLDAMGDVVRTTPVLRVLNGNVYWVTNKRNIPLLPTHNGYLKQVIDINEADEVLSEQKFDVVLSLDDDFETAKLATIVKKDNIIGSFLDSDGRITYTDSSAGWFDMGLISKFGKKVADELKKKNIKTYQEILFEMIGKKFNGEEYLLNFESQPSDKRNVIGIEARAGERWPTKVWNKYEQLAQKLQAENYEVNFLKQRKNIMEYIKDIDECKIIVTGDTLSMHIALALKIPTVSIFTCTSPTEIYDYGRMIKIVSPLLDKAFYRQEYFFDVVDAIPLETVYNAVINLLTDKNLTNN